MFQASLWYLNYVIDTLFMADPILKVKNLSVNLGSRRILENLSFAVEHGQTMAIIGPNGAGKTVLFRALIGAVPYEGAVEWARGIKIGYVPQRLDLDPQLPVTLADLLALKTKILGLPPAVADEAARLVRLDKTDMALKIINLAAGKLQRALIALALIGDPDVLLFDEPTSSVDLPREELIYDTLHEIQHNKGITLILISHDLNLVFSHAAKVLCLNRRMMCFGEPQQSLNTELLSKLYGERVFYHHDKHHHADSGHD